MATQFRDMPLGGTSGFASQYTPIRFAPLVSLTGPIAAPPPTAAAPEEQMMRPQMPLMDQSGFGTGDESQGLPYAGGTSIGSRSADQTRGDLMNIGGFLMSPIGSMLNYAMTGQKPGEALQAMVDSFRGQTPSGAQGGGFGFQNPFAGLSNWFSGKVFGPEEVSLYETRAPVGTAIPSMVFDGGMYSVTPELSPIGQTNAIFNDPAFYNAIAAGVPMEQIAAAIGISPAAMAQMAADAVKVSPIRGGGDEVQGSIDGSFSGDFGGFGEASGPTGGWV